MAHGGTNFGTWSGANRMGNNLTDDYRSTVTSYDYDAPIAEDGSPTEKFWRMRDVLAAYDRGHPGPAPGRAAPAPSTNPAGRIGAALRHHHGRTGERAPRHRRSRISTRRTVWCSIAPTFPGHATRHRSPVDGLADRAHLFVDGEFQVAVLDETHNAVEVPGGVRVDLLVESMGRTNYGPMVGERKGITGSVRHGLPFRARLAGVPD